MFQGCKATKVKVRQGLKMTLTAKFVEYSRVVARFEALGFYIQNLEEFFKLDLRDMRYCAKNCVISTIFMKLCTIVTFRL